MSSSSPKGVSSSSTKDAVSSVATAAPLATYGVITPNDEGGPDFPAFVVALTERHMPPMALVLEDGKMAMRVTRRFVAKPAAISPRAYALLMKLETVEFVSVTEAGVRIGSTTVPVEKEKL